MKRLGALFLFIAAALCGCRGGGGEGAAPEVEARPRIQYHIGMFQGYDPPWVDHSRWMKPSAIKKEESGNDRQRLNSGRGVLYDLFMVSLRVERTL